MKNWPNHRARVPVAAWITFLAASTLALGAIWYIERLDLHNRRNHASIEAASHAQALQRAMERTLSSTFTLATLVEREGGVFADFDLVATRMLPLYPGASSLQLAPGGVVSKVVPLLGNEKAIGHDLLQDATRSEAAVLARDTGKLTLDGPFNLVQGGTAAVGRQPVFLLDSQGRSSFWGFTSVLIRVPEILNVVRISGLEAQGLAWELSRMSIGDRQRLIIASSGHGELVDPVQSRLEVPNASWTLRVMPVAGWYAPLRLALRIALGLLLCTVMAYAVKLVFDLRRHERGLEALVAARTAELARREAQLNHAQYVAQIGSWALVEGSGGELRASAQALRILGTDGQATINYETFLRLVHPLDQQAVRQTLRAALKGAPYDIEYRVVVDSAIRWIRSKAELTVDADGKLSSANGTLQDITERKAAEAEIERYVAELQSALTSTVAVATRMGEIRDPYTAGHAQRVGQLAVAIGANLGFDAHRLEGLRVAGCLHDIGKIVIPAEILSKPGKLSAIEFRLIQGHPQLGYDVLKEVRFPWPVAEVTLQHHERMDGTGYPQGLKGEAIGLEARITAVADVVEAMSSDRPYRAGLGLDKALAEIERGRGSAYDAQVVDACLKAFREQGYVVGT